MYIRILRNIEYSGKLNRNTIDISKLVKYIKNELNEFKIPCNNIYFTIQNKDILNRNIEIIDTQYEEDIN
ncbi:MAG: hypothetical protein ACRCXT_12170, partial [Paraclostridium sp.]